MTCTSPRGPQRPVECFPNPSGKQHENGGSEANKQFVYLKIGFKFRPLSWVVLLLNEILFNRGRVQGGLFGVCLGSGVLGHCVSDPLPQPSWDHRSTGQL